MQNTQKLKMGMIGGGPGSFIGAIHRSAALLDGLIELTAGAFSSDPVKSKQAGEALMLDPSRVYESYDQMLEMESRLPASERIDIVSIVTPNHAHFGPTKKALELGFHVILDKPMTLDYSEAKELYRIIHNAKTEFALTHTYTGYPMVKQAKQMVADGVIGEVRKVYVEYPQGWLWKLLETEDNKQAQWRTDPSRSGSSGCFGDIGTHAFNLAEYVSGQKVAKICADIDIKVAGRKLDDDGALLMRFENNASGILTASQIDTGAENNLKIKVYGDKGGLEWQQEDCNTLIVRWPNEPDQIYRAGTPYLSSLAQENTRTPAGHPEGYIEAFANIYRNFARCIVAKQKGQQPKKEWLDYPGAEDGIRGMAFVQHVLDSAESDMKWTPLVVEK
ncbi:Gfo/Idh/MocA family protein [Belliella kenyensis]|uniref:Gfo/Idh/MocA family protein n=1 Tax=Belliella kenyensis TaxID=1472724 RepID=A0ABV8EJP3_9BACT|nr:Gfo/Idh/MocA family oxidoreductase [Belliella kenyensis]MCH7403140.1 Gfo/Idh/MocA family oxidoreductase [Belliella kenyensis]MDN3602309.1 Gfo/Idh/MocA family oxidoreductase [Belliella kenyensis]